MSKTKVIVKAKDGRVKELIFDSYQEASSWISENTIKHGIKIDLIHAQFDREPTIEVYKETKNES